MGERRAILIIDDDEEDTYLLAQVIERYFPHYQAIPLTNSLTALEELKELKRLPVLILLDLQMPEKSGLEVLTELRSYPAYEQLPVAIISECIDPANQVELDPLGVLDYLEKLAGFPQTRLQLERLMERINMATE